MNRWAYNIKSPNVSAVAKMIDNEEFATWVRAFDKKDFKKYQKENIQPFESIFLKLGAEIMKNASNFLAANPAKVVQEIRNENQIWIVKTTNGKEFQTPNIVIAGGVGSFEPRKFPTKNAEKFDGSSVLYSIKDKSIFKDLKSTQDISKMSLLKTQLDKIKRLGGFEKIVPIEGIVFVYGGQTFKLTGAFAPINQILGTLKYSR